MKSLALLIILHISFHALCQGKLELGLSGSYEKAANAQQESHNQFQITTFSGGLTADYKTSVKYLQIGTGLIYDRNGYYQFHSWDAPNKRFVYYNMDYLTVPIKLSGSYGEKFFIRGSLGLNASYLINSKSFISSAPTEKASSKTGSIEASIFAQIGGGFYLNEHIGFHLHMDIMRGLTSFDQDYYGWLKHKKRGITLGIIYKI